MRHIAFITIAALCATPTARLAGQSTTSEVQGENRLPRNQLALEAGDLLAFSVSYVRRIIDTDFGVGAGVGFAWELNRHNFNANIWEATHGEVFVRYQLERLVQLDLGVTAMRYFWTDDCSECMGTFFGLHSAAMVGYRYFFVGVNARLGWKNDDWYGSEFGVILSPQVRVVVPWG